MLVLARHFDCFMPHLKMSFLSGLAAIWLSGAALAQSNGPALVVDASTGAVLVEERGSQAWHPASTTKMMTAYIALRAVRAGRIGLETPIPASALAAKQPRVKVYIKPGQEITLDNALKIMMVKSANDIAYVIAEGVGGNVPTFVEMMNAEARRLGMRDTLFTNPNGWHDPDQQVSARDLAVLAMTMLREFPEYVDYWGMGAVQLGRVTLTNTNGLIGRYAGANGFKTGFVCASGFNVVATATRGGRTLIAVVLGAYSGAERTVKAAQILDQAFSAWSGTGRTLASIPASGTRATNICADVRAFGRGAPLADDVDNVGPISYAAAIPSSDYGLMYAGMGGQPQASTARSTGGRITLGPRAQFSPVLVGYGRTGGSANAPLAANVANRPANAVTSAPAAAPVSAAAARGGRSQPAGIGAVAEPAAEIASRRPRTASSNGAIPAASVAAPTGAVVSSAVAGAAAAYAASRATDPAAAAPVRLHGAIGQGSAAPARPATAAGIRPAPKPQTAAIGPAPRAASGEARPAAVKPAPIKPASTKPAIAKPATQASATGKPSTRALVKPKPAETPPRRPAQSDD